MFGGPGSCIHERIDRIRWPLAIPTAFETNIIRARLSGCYKTIGSAAVSRHPRELAPCERDPDATIAGAR